MGQKKKKNCRGSRLLQNYDRGPDFGQAPLATSWWRGAQELKILVFVVGVTENNTAIT